MSINVVIADDHAIVRQGLISLLEQDQDIKVIGEAENGQDAIMLVDKLQPDLLIIDVSMSVMNGIDATRVICKENPNIKILGLSMHKNLNYVLHMFQAGAHGYILKDSAFEDIISAIEAVIKNELYLSEKLNITVTDILRNMKEYNQNLESQKKLSPRERQVLQLLAEGQGTKQIARIISRSVKTVESHRKNIMDKLNIHTVAGLTSYAIQEGIIQLEG